MPVEHDRFGTASRWEQAARLSAHLRYAGIAALILSMPSLTTAQDPSAARTATARATSERGRERLMREVRHELVMLPHYGVFDHLAFRVNDGEVELFGQVTRPTLKSDAENVVRRIEGVERVINRIEVLPVSPSDDQLRLALFRAIYGHSALNRYALQAVPPIHIIVKNGDVTLEGTVASEADRNIAYIQANGVPGVFSVKINLRVAP
jgi:hyperosmotically inducible protein